MPEVVPASAPKGVVQPGDVLEGRYRLQRVIAAGGMGTVFLAEHVLIQRRVAIKVLHSELARDIDVVERFMNEARAAGTLGHPNIVESTDMGFARGDVPYIVFEYLEGTLLSDEVYRTRGMPPRRALKIAHQIASALQAAHRAGIVHRDLKTDNIFLTDKDDALDHVKVLDFGISRFLEADSDRTGRGGRRTTLMGTPESMAPEQILTPESVDARADIYALGVVLYEMLAGRLPFTNTNPDDPHELLHRIVRDEVPPMARTDLPVGLAEAIREKLLAKDREARYQTMGDVLGALEAFLSVVRPTHESIPPLALGSTEIPTLPALPAAPQKRRAGWLLVPAVLAAAAGAALWWTAESTSTTQPPDVSGLEREADQFASTLDSVTTAAQLRAESMATSPMLRAAIETDSATLADMARDGTLFQPKPGETIEIFQLRDGATTSLLRLPRTASPLSLAAKPQLVGSGDALALVVTVPILEQSGDAAGGTLALAMPIDTRSLIARIGDQAVAAKLVGNDVAITLAERGTEGVERELPVRAKVAQLSLVATVSTPVIATPPNLLPAYACFGAAGLFGLLFLVGLVLRR